MQSIRVTGVTLIFFMTSKKPEFVLYFHLYNIFICIINQIIEFLYTYIYVVHEVLNGCKNLDSLKFALNM